MHLRLYLDNAVRLKFVRHRKGCTFWLRSHIHKHTMVLYGIQWNIMVPLLMLDCRWCIECGCKLQSINKILDAHNKPKEKTAKRKYARTSTSYTEINELKSNCGSCACACINIIHMVASLFHLSYFKLKTISFSCRLINTLAHGKHSIVIRDSNSQNLMICLLNLFFSPPL